MQKQSILVAQNFSRADHKKLPALSLAIYKQQMLPKAVMYIQGLQQPMELNDSESQNMWHSSKESEGANKLLTEFLLKLR